MVDLKECWFCRLQMHDFCQSRTLLAHLEHCRQKEKEQIFLPIMCRTSLSKHLLFRSICVVTTCLFLLLLKCSKRAEKGSTYYFLLSQVWRSPNFCKTSVAWFNSKSLLRSRLSVEASICGDRYTQGRQEYELEKGAGTLKFL